MPNLRHSPGIYLEGLGKIANIFNQDSRPLARDLNLGSPQYEARLLTLVRNRCDATLAIRKGERSNHGENSITVTLRVHFLSCYYGGLRRKAVFDSDCCHFRCLVL